MELFPKVSLQQLVSMSLLTSLATAAAAASTSASKRESRACGGRLRAPHGVIQTPQFPNAFPVPIKCKWIISHELPNGTISIYFTQQYTTSGLSFTEYMYYDDSYKLGERRAFQVTEENITRVKWLQVQSPVLVVELSLDALEGTQLRALGLLAVYGLNITYAVNAPPSPTPPPSRAALASKPAAPAAVAAAPAALASCSALECRLLGHCYATHDYQKFYCACFEGYSGADCGEGPLCSPNLCKHGGLCRQMGPAAVSCICAPGYTGDLCESEIAAPECGIEECSEGCSNDCNCNPKDSDATSARFETRLQILDQPSGNISQETINQIITLFKATNITLDDDIEVVNISVDADARTDARWVVVRTWGARRASGALRSALARLLAASAHRDVLPLVPTSLHVDVHPALSLHELTVNQRSEVWAGSEFILSCTAYGSPNIRFTWYKDGVKIHFNGTLRDIWTRTVAEDALGRRISVLGVSEAKQLDSGRWSCVADDAGRRRCRALWLTVLRSPDIRLMPSSLTVNKGDNVSITCLASASRVHGALGFSWARERTLLPLVPGREVWEDLYPAGSVLKLYNIQKSGEYRCQVSSVAGTSAKGVTLWALGPNDQYCESSASHGLRWPKTAPGAHASAACPTSYTGSASRFCEPKTTVSEVKWRQPDFSNCIAESLENIYEQFIRVSYGFSWTDVASIAHQYGAVLRSLPAHPGDGTIPLLHAREMLHYLLSDVGKPSDRTESSGHLLKIFDTLLKHPDAFLDEENTYKLQNAVVETMGMTNRYEHEYHEFTVMSKPTQEDYAAHFKIPLRNFGPEEWLIASVGVELFDEPTNASIIVVEYHNLGARLPSLGSSIEFKDGRETEYLLASQQIQLSANGPVDKSLPHKVTILFTHIYNYSAIAEKLACGLRTASEPHIWSTKACEVQVPEPKYVTCRCRGLGTFALLTVARSTLTEKDLQGVVKITASIGGAMCFAVAILQLLGLVSSKKSKLLILLKATTAGAHSAAILTLLDCDSRQESVCAGTWGWVCALCWCVGSAALCAQPLLLQAELAARASSAPATGLLAGVCILICLTARLWGGSPLQLGAAAQVVCAIGTISLMSLCLALCICSALRLRTITHKVPVERRKYIKERQMVIRQTLTLLVTTSAAQIAGIAYAQPGERQSLHVIFLATTALVNGIAMLVCYVICDEECMMAARRVLSLSPHRDWEVNSPVGDTSLSLYIKQGGEVESRGGVIDSSSSQISPVTSYWHPQNSLRLHRRLSTPDRGDCGDCADIVRCVEYAECSHLHRPDPVPCDLVPRTLPSTCVLCTRSTPDVSAYDQTHPIKSCLKKTNTHFSSSVSLPSMDEARSRSNIEQVNRQWNKAYSARDTDKVLDDISSDLNFLLNKPVCGNGVLNREAPT